jgi:excisionase family DNA binding protein
MTTSKEAPETALLDRKEAAAYLNISKGTLQKLNIPRFNIGRKVLYERPAIDQWIADRRAGEHE